MQSRSRVAAALAALGIAALSLAGCASRGVVHVRPEPCTEAEKLREPSKCGFPVPPRQPDVSPGPLALPDAGAEAQRRAREWDAAHPRYGQMMWTGRTL